MGGVTRWPNPGEDYSHELAQVKLIVRWESTDWKSIKVYLEANVSPFLALRFSLVPVLRLFVYRALKLASD